MTSGSPTRTTHGEAWWAKAPAHIVRCTARYRDGSPCRRVAAGGANVCGQHGGLAPQVIHAAHTRIAMSAEDAAARLVEWMNDPGVDVRERLKAAESLLDRSGVSGVNKVLVGVTTDDPVETLLRNLLSDPNALVDPTAAPPTPDPYVLDLNRQVLEEAGDIVDAELVEEPSPERSTRNPATPPRHIREALERLL